MLKFSTQCTWTGVYTDVCEDVKMFKPNSWYKILAQRSNLTYTIFLLFYHCTLMHKACKTQNWQDDNPVPLVSCHCVWMTVLSLT